MPEPVSPKVPPAPECPIRGVRSVCAQSACGVRTTDYFTQSCDSVGMLMIGFNETFLTFLPNVAVFIE